MKHIYKLLIITVLLPLAALAAKETGSLKTSNIKFNRIGSNVQLSADLVLDSLRLGGNRQIYVTPVVEGPGGENVALPSVLVNGRNMHYAYLRGNVPKEKHSGYDIAYEVRRHNGRQQSLHYTALTPMEAWMLDPSAAVRMVLDTCGCGRAAGSSVGTPTPLNLNPAPRMRLVYRTPEITEQPVSVHEGRARVQFEVDRTELHDIPYTCRNGQRIDNRAQLKIIEDSVRYALSDPNVEIASIDICGYASPESPYLHNEYLATNRSRALSEYIGRRFNLPTDKCTYSSVPENWGEFREMVENASDITPVQRRELLALIDRPAYGPSDYDAKEKELKTDPRFAQLYRGKILPQWFPQLRCTKFAINTRLKPLDDKKLDEVIRKTPELMSLNQMFRVARLYPEGSDQFNEVIGIARQYYPEDPVANINAAVAAMHKGDFDAAASMLGKAGNSPEAENARGVLAARKGDFETALRHFEAAGNLPEALKNKALLIE